MHLVKCDNLPLDMAHDGCVLFVIWGFALWLCAGGNRGGDPQTVRYVHIGFNMPAHWFGLTFVHGHTSHPSFGLCFAGAETE